MARPPCTWEFPRSGGGQEYGLNNAGVALFSADTIYSFTRETIQNSVDAVQDKSKPVEVVFELKKVRASEIPDCDILLQHIKRARSDVERGMSAAHFAENGKAIFDAAIAVLGRTEIPVLRCGDSNTTGLTGAENAPDGAWVRLVRRQGSPAMHGVGGGSYGIGQMAPFAASQARALFYGTKTATDQRFIGKAIWCSVHEGDDTLQHIGFWGAKGAVGRAPLTNKEWIPPFAKREVVGTDIFVVGFRDELGWEGAVIDAVLTNFFAAIVRKKLIVTVQGVAISASTIAALVTRRIDERMKAATNNQQRADVRKTLAATKVYISALATQPRVRALKKLGAVELYVARDENGPERVAHMRSPLMLVHDRKFPVLTHYGAVFVCTTDEGNRLLREYEGPEHCSWVKKVPGREAVIADINEFIRDTLADLSTDSSGEEDVKELAEYLPEELPSVSTGLGSPKVKEHLQNQETGARAPRAGKPRVEAELPPRRTARRQEDEADVGDEEGSGGSGQSGEEGGTQTSGEQPGSGDGTKGKAAPGQLRRLHDADLRLRSWYVDGGTQILIASTRRGEARALFRLVGEDGAIPLQWRVTNEDGSTIEVDEDQRYILRFEDQTRLLRLCLRTDRRVSLALEVA